MFNFVLEVIAKEKNRWSEVGNFPRKRGGSLGSFKYHNTFTNLYLINLIKAQSRMRKHKQKQDMKSNKIIEIF